MAAMANESRALLNRALTADDINAIEELIRGNPSLLDDAKQRPALTLARSVTTAERLLKLGASIDAAGRWWAPGFYTRTVSADVARYLVDQGAALTIHAAAGLGFTDKLAEMLQADAMMIHAKGGDGC